MPKPVQLKSVLTSLIEAYATLKPYSPLRNGTVDAALTRIFAAIIIIVAAGWSFTKFSRSTNAKEHSTSVSFPAMAHVSKHGI